ncbi:MAG: NAD(P)-binding domain-containing protein [Bacteroidota bacterium]
MQKYLIIGAGPAGLAAAVALKKAHIPFEMVDAGDKVGGIWDIERKETPMYKSAHFISSKTLSGFQDYPMPEEYPDYPSHSLVQSYIEKFSDHHRLEPFARFKTRVKEMKPVEDKWEVRFEDGSQKTYQGVICATGITWHLNHPQIEGEFEGEYIHSFAYKDSSVFKGKRVLIIGAGNSGCDIACDAAKEADKAFISLRRGYYFLPKYTLGMPSDLFKEKFSIPFKALDTRISEFLLNKVFVGKLSHFGLPEPDHRLMESHPIMNNRLLHYLGHGDIIARKNVSSFEGKEVIFEDGSREEIDLIIAATGYKRIFPFLSENHVDYQPDDKEVDLYLEIFSKKYDNLFFIGGIEVASAVFGLFSLQGQAIASYLNAQEQDSAPYQKFLKERNQKTVNLKGKSKYVDSMRHKRYVDKERYKSILTNQINAFAQ